MARVTYMAQYYRGTKLVSFSHHDLEVFKRLVAKVQAINPARTIYLYTVEVAD